jgi:PhnO protein
MEIRKIEIGDLDEVYKLLNDLYNNNLKYEIFAKIYKEKVFDNNSYYIVAVINGKIVGVLTSEIQTKLHREKKQIFVEDLVVDKNYRNNGIGKELLQNAIEYAKKQDCEIVELTCYLKNDNAHKFYEDNGFIKQSYKFKKYLNL